jgi:hypothetical protein
MITKLNKGQGTESAGRAIEKKIFLAYLTTVLMATIIFIIKEIFCEYTVFLQISQWKQSFILEVSSLHFVPYLCI